MTDECRTRTAAIQCSQNHNTHLNKSNLHQQLLLNFNMNSWRSLLLLLGAISTISSVNAFTSSVFYLAPSSTTAFVRTAPRSNRWDSPSTTTKSNLPQSPLARPYQLTPDIETATEDIVIPIDLSSIKDIVASKTVPSKSKSSNQLLDTPTVPPKFLQDVTVSLLPLDEQKRGSFKKFPLVVEPKAQEQRSLDFLSNFVETNRGWIDDMMLQYGAVLFRGFDIDSERDVQSAIMSYEPNLNNSYRGTSPRNVQGGTEFVFSAAEVPSHYPIAQHIEMSFLPAPPRKLFFSAIKAPKTVGGETALADFRKVYQDLPIKLRNKLADKKLLYRRTHSRKGRRFSHDVAAMQGWPEVFGTSDKTEVEKISRSEDMPMQWEGRNKDRFVSEFVSEPFQLHPETNEPVWFNHAQVFHWTTFPAELFAAFRRTRDWRLFFHALQVSAVSIVKYGLLRQKMALTASFGDGTPISIWEMHQIRRAVHKNMIFNRWKKGDILMIDNFSTSHGRQPTYDKGRKVVVAWSDPLVKPNLFRNQKTISAATLTMTNQISNDGMPSIEQSWQ